MKLRVAKKVVSSQWRAAIDHTHKTKLRAAARIRLWNSKKSGRWWRSQQLAFIEFIGW